MELAELNDDHRVAIIDVLVRAFHDYAVMKYFIGASGPKYDSKLRVLNQYYTDARLLRNWPVLGILEDNQICSVALVSPPLTSDPEPLPALVAETRTIVGDEVWIRMKDFDRLSDTTMPDGPQHFVGMLGTLPEYQGRGCGTRLLNHIKQMSQTEGSIGVTLSTETESNVGYYERQGFKVTGEVSIGGITSWGMLWKNPGL